MFETVKKSDNSRYANSDVIRLVKLKPIVSFSFYKWSTSSGEHLEDISHAHIFSLFYKLLFSAKKLTISILDSVVIVLEVSVS